MTMESLTRRTLLTGLGAVICAPAIVRATSLMRVKSFNDFGYITDADAWFLNTSPGLYTSFPRRVWWCEKRQCLVFTAVDATDIYNDCDIDLLRADEVGWRGVYGSHGS